MLNIETMRAIGKLIAKQAREKAMNPEIQSNEVIDLGPLLIEWSQGTIQKPIAYNVGDIRYYNGMPWKCVQNHPHYGQPNWQPGKVSMWAPYHGTDAQHALPWTKPTGAHDMYQIGQFMIWTDGEIYECIQATNFSPEEYPQAWKKNREDTEEPEQSIDEEWPEWYPWDHVSEIPWQQGSKCTYNGQRYISKVNNNVWQPTESSVWEKQV